MNYLENATAVRLFKYYNKSFVEIFYKNDTVKCFSKSKVLDLKNTNFRKTKIHHIEVDELSIYLAAQKENINTVYLSFSEEENDFI
jgi:hypothetical protein